MDRESARRWTERQWMTEEMCERNKTRKDHVTVKV